MNKKIILPIIFIFSFIFLINFTSAVATISQIPNVNIGYLDSHFFTVTDYATGEDNVSTTITFTNPQNQQPVTLYGDIGGQHCNTYFCISLTPNGYVQIISYTTTLNSLNILVGVGNSYQTQAGTSFLLNINTGGFNTNTFVNINERTQIIDLNDYFPSYTSYFFLRTSDGLGTRTISDNTRFWSNDTIRYQIDSTNTKEGKFLTLAYMYDNENNYQFNISSGGHQVVFNVTYTDILGSAKLLGPIQIKHPNFENTSGFIVLDDYISGYKGVDHNNDGFKDFCRNENYVSTYWNLTYVTDHNSNRYHRFYWNNPTGSNIEFDITFDREASCVPATQGLSAVNDLIVHFILPGTNSTSGIVINGTSQSGNVNTLRIWWTGLFPNKENLTMKEKWGYNVIFLLLPFVIVLTMSILSKNRLNLKLLAWCAIISDIAIFFYLIAIGYISVTILVVIALMVLGYSYFRRGS